MAPPRDEQNKAAAGAPRRLCYYNGGFLWNARLRRIMALAGHDLALGLPRAGDGVVVWGHSPYSTRGEAIAARFSAPLVRVEDAFLRSVKLGRQGAAPIGLMIDPLGAHYDPRQPSRIEDILCHHPLDDSPLLARARDGIARMQAMQLSKYNLHDLALRPPAAGYVLVIDQTRGDASITQGGADAARFAEMLQAARYEHPHAQIVIKTHPEVQAGLRAGHFGAPDADGRVTLCSDPVSPWALLEGAIAVYTISSQMGYEAILAGHRPQVFGQPFYAGWGLTDDRAGAPLRRGRKLTKVQLFAAAMILAPVWYDAHRDQLASFETALDQIEAEVRAFRHDRAGHVAWGMRLWKRGRLQAFFGAEKPVVFAKSAGQAVETAQAKGRGVMVWAGREGDLALAGLPLLRIEDGFLRSRGLGAELVPPLSLVADGRGIYYDPSRPSDLEHLLTSPLPAGGAARAEHLMAKLVAGGVTKYNLAGESTLPADLPAGHRILVVGQVEDDASIRLGALGEVTTNLGLLRAARAANPQAVIIYKPHPDVEAGLRAGRIDAVLAPPDQAQSDLASPEQAPPNHSPLADHIAHHADPLSLIAACDEVWTMTSLLGFEALIRGKPVTCLGTPFFAGWGLTRDLGPVPERRKRLPDGSLRPALTLPHLVHATLITYPRYYDPITRSPCPPEVAVDRLATGPLPRAGLSLRLLSKLQGALASQAWLWR